MRTANAYGVVEAIAEAVRQDGVVHDALDLSAFYGDYRADGHGRPAHDPAMMVGLLLYGYAHRCSACVPSGDCRYGLP